METKFQEFTRKPSKSYTWTNHETPWIWKTRQFDDILLRHCNQNTIERWTKGCILGLAKNYRSITLTSIAAKIYNALLRNRIEPKIENILRKNQNGFQRNRSTKSQIWLSVEFLKVYAQKTYRQQYYLSTLPRPLTPFTEERWSKLYSPTAYPKKPSQP